MDNLANTKTKTGLTKILPKLMTCLVVTACSSQSGTFGTKHNLVDTINSFKIDHLWATPKKSFDFNSLGKSSGDTLHLVTCSEFVYFPFGELKDKSSLKNSVLKDFKITKSELDTFTNIMLPSDPSDDFKEWSESLELELGRNKLSLFLDNDPEASTHGYIRGGQIMDGNVAFRNSIRVGMSVQNFYNLFFDYFPAELRSKYIVVELESCVNDVMHIYTFEEGKLRSVEFIPQ